jgi:hypothetical protein
VGTGSYVKCPSYQSREVFAGLNLREKEEEGYV